MENFIAIKKLRKNASLKAVAVATRKDADRASARWRRYNEAQKACAWVDRDKDSLFKSEDLYRQWSGLDAIACHLERLA